MLKRLYVFVWQNGTPLLAGHIETTGPEWPPAARSSRFQYASAWLNRCDVFPVDPVNLPIMPGWQYIPDGFQVPGAIRDATPDGWGKHVIQLEHPDARFGALEYAAATRNDRSGFLAFGPDEYRPANLFSGGPINLTEAYKLCSLEMSFEAAQLVEDEKPLPERLSRYFAAASSLGGARPKATFVDADGEMWVAKFPKRGDLFAVMDVEAACLDMAAELGIETPEHHIQKVGSSSVLLVRRFDRIVQDGVQHRLGYLSAETVLGGDPMSYSTTFGYADLASAAQRFGSRSGGEVFRRMLLNVLVGNTDDHLRNHAFLMGLDGRWALSPVYDVVPQPGRRRMVLAVADSHGVDFTAAVKSFANFGISADEADAITRKATEVAGRWREFMAARAVSETDVSYISPAFAEADRHAPRAAAINGPAFL